MGFFQATKISVLIDLHFQRPKDVLKTRKKLYISNIPCPNEHGAIKFGFLVDLWTRGMGGPVCPTVDAVDWPGRKELVFKCYINVLFNNNYYFQRLFAYKYVDFFF